MNDRERRLAAVLVSILSGCATSRAAPAAPERAVLVDLTQVRTAPVDDASEYVGRIESRRSIDLLPQVEGRITKIYVASGDTVAPGQPVVEIDPREQRAEVRAAHEQRRSADATLVNARAQYERAKRLFEKGAISQAEHDQTRANYEAAEANVASQVSRVKAESVQLRYFTVTAPFEGVVGDIIARLGDRVTTSTVLTTIDQHRRLQIYVYVPGEEASKVQLGVRVQIVVSDRVVDEGTIDFVSPRIDRDTQTVLVTASVASDGGALRQDEQVRARIVFGTRDRMLVPTTAISRLGAQAFVFVAERSGEALVVRQRPVELGVVAGNDYIVEKVLQSGDQIVVSGAQKLADGTPVRPSG